MKNTLPQKTFLLGGYDLEMLTIKQMLEDSKDCIILDKHLRWDNAFLSAYQDELKGEAYPIIFGIELQEDVPVPNNYYRIDHHNDWSDKPSSLEQVAGIIGVELNRHQQLVAANDKGYIPAMERLDATKEEISDIRRQDRRAQGVSPVDEALAAKSIETNLSRHGDLLVVKSYSQSFSPICDTLFPFKNLLIYTNTEWVFYGEGKGKLVDQFSHEISLKRMYHGGGENGYVGTVKNEYNTDEIAIFVEQLKKEYE